MKKDSVFNSPAFSPVDLQKIHAGEHNKLHEILGAHVLGTQTVFRVYAPHAQAISVIGDFNHWDQEAHQLNRLNDCIWEIIVEQNLDYAKYKYRILKSDGTISDKTDPFAFYSEVRPFNSSIVYDHHKDNIINKNYFNNQPINFNQPISIYELHLRGFMDGLYTYETIGQKILAHVKEMNYTHIEIMPIMEYPQDCSWGYQAVSYFAPTSRYGTPDQFKKLVEMFHDHGIGVILDWIPVHFANDDYGLIAFDGTPLFEYKTKMDANNESWGTINFDLGSGFVRSFLLSNLDFYRSIFNIDGARYDAVSYIIYWNGATEINPLGIDFLKSINTHIKVNHPDFLLIAEDSSAYGNVTTPTFEGGLGFDYKWNLGWMHDTLKFFKTSFEDRQNKFNHLTFSFVYMNTEKFILPLSHDEVVHMKNAVADKMYGTYEQKMQQVKVLFAHLFIHPGKKLNFMGNDLATFEEFSEQRQLNWHLLTYPIHHSFNQLVKMLNKIYREHSVLSHDANLADNFEYLYDHVADGILSYKRKNTAEEIIIILNLSPTNYYNYRFLVNTPNKLDLILDTNWDQYSGTTPMEIKSFNTELIDHCHYLFDDVSALSAKIYLCKGTNENKTNKRSIKKESKPKKAIKEQISYQQMNKVQLIERAKEYNLKGYSKLTKQDLIMRLTEHDDT